MPTQLDAAINFEDLRKLAKRRLPRIAYDFIDGGVEDEHGLARNEEAFRRYQLVPRYGIDVRTIDQSTTLFGRTFSGPIGIAPTGLAGLFRRGGDLMLAQAAKFANVPFIMSGSTATRRSRNWASSRPSTAGTNSIWPGTGRFLKTWCVVREMPAFPPSSSLSTCRRIRSVSETCATVSAAP